MASRVEFAVSATPIFTHAAGEGVATDSIAADVGHTVSGSGSQSVTWGTTTGFAAGVPAYITGDGGSIATTSAKCIYIKHTGYNFVSSAVLGTANAELLIIVVGAVTIAKLNPGQAIFLPFNSSTTSNTYALSSGGDAMAVEYFWTA